MHYGQTGYVNNRSLLVFVRVPEKGKVKSRLAKRIDEQMVIELYECFVLDIIETLKKGGAEFRICFYPASSGEKIVRWLGKDHLYMPQEGEDIGERMERAFVGSFSEGREKVLLIGSDIPDLTNSMIDEAFESLERNDAVIGPASDGGYYLIGFKKSSFLPDIFHGVAWSTGSVFKETLKIFKELDCNVRILPEWRDVDTVEDLRSLFERNIDTDFRKSRTMSCIMSWKERNFLSADHEI